MENLDQMPTKLKCKKCGHKWWPLDENVVPKMCPECKTTYWQYYKCPECGNRHKGRHCNNCHITEFLED